MPTETRPGSQWSRQTWREARSGTRSTMGRVGRQLERSVKPVPCFSLLMLAVGFTTSPRPVGPEALRMSSPFVDGISRHTGRSSVLPSMAWRPLTMRGKRWRCLLMGRSWPLVCLATTAGVTTPDWCVWFASMPARRPGCRWEQRSPEQPPPKRLARPFRCLRTARPWLSVRRKTTRWPAMQARCGSISGTKLSKTGPCRASRSVVGRSTTSGERRCRSRAMVRPWRWEPTDTTASTSTLDSPASFAGMEIHRHGSRWAMISVV